MRSLIGGCVCAALLMVSSQAHGDVPGQNDNAVTVPILTDQPRRPVTVDDLLGVRQIDSLSLSPDRRAFAIFVHQADPSRNTFRTGWFIGSADGTPLRFVGEGGELTPRVRRAGDVVGDVSGGESRWSPDGQWIAYQRETGGERQLWRSSVDGTVVEQVTHSGADVRDFEWSDDGRSLVFQVISARETQRREAEKKERNGYRYDEDLRSFADLLGPHLVRDMLVSPLLRVVNAAGTGERLASDDERRQFESARARRTIGVMPLDGLMIGVEASPAVRADGTILSLERISALTQMLRIKLSHPRSGQPDIVCAQENCTGVIRRVWWSKDGRRVHIWKNEGINNRANGFYAWSPESNKVAPVFTTVDDDLRLCEPLPDDRLVCVSDTPSRPTHLATVNLRSGKLQLLQDVNPEFAHIQLARVERFEWNTPVLPWNEPNGELAGFYPRRAYGYILYPPGFDPSKKYPVFIEPSAANGFGPAWSEHPLQVYAAKGFVVLRTEFPMINDVALQRGATLMRDVYSPELDFPHLTMMMEATRLGLDAVVRRGFVDERRVGIGGVSHGTFVPLYMMQKYDRIAAISISGPGWGTHEYYAQTAKGRGFVRQTAGKMGYVEWERNPDEPEGRDFWSRLDIADHVDSIEAPVLMNLAASEAYGSVRLIRNMADAGKPYDAYVFPNETHLKWQPAHLQAIMNRNLDWFRFWLQEYEDPDASKAEQYAKWRALKPQQNSALLRGIEPASN